MKSAGVAASGSGQLGLMTRHSHAPLAEGKHCMTTSDSEINAFLGAASNNTYLPAYASWLVDTGVRPSHIKHAKQRFHIMREPTACCCCCHHFHHETQQLLSRHLTKAHAEGLQEYSDPG